MIYLPNGSNILVRRPGILPAGIRFFMRDQFNHTEKIVHKDGGIYTFGAVKDGCIYRPLEKAIKDEKWKRIEVWHPKFNFPDEQLIAICDRFDGTPYQKINFLQWLIFLRYGKWLGKSSTRRMYCYELTARICEELLHGTFPKGHFIERTHIKQFRDLDAYELYGVFDVSAGKLKKIS